MKTTLDSRSGLKMMPRILITDAEPVSTDKRAIEMPRDKMIRSGLDRYAASSYVTK